MNKAEIKKESLEHWKRHFDEASNLYNNSITSQRATLAVSFGATALGLTVMKSLPQSDIIYGTGATLLALNSSLAIFANKYFSNYKKFYKSVKHIAGLKYTALLNNNNPENEKFITFEEFENNVAKETGIEKPCEKNEYYINQSSLAGLATAVGVAWYFSVTKPEESINVRLENHNIWLYNKDEAIQLPKAP